MSKIVYRNALTSTIIPAITMALSSCACSTENTSKIISSSASNSRFKSTIVGASQSRESTGADCSRLSDLPIFFNPPAPRRAQGAHSGTIGPSPLQSEISNLYSTSYDQGPRRALLINQLGIFCYANKLDKEAITYFHEAIAIEQNCPRDISSHGAEYSQRMGFEDEWYCMSLEKSDTHLTSSFKVAPAIKLTHQKRLAGYKRNLELCLTQKRWRDFEKSITSNEPLNNARTLFDRALVYKGMKKTELALKDFSESIKLYERGFDGSVTQLRGSRNGLPTAYWERACLYQSLGKENLAKADLTRARKLMSQARQ